VREVTLGFFVSFATLNLFSRLALKTTKPSVSFGQVWFCLCWRYTFT